MHGSDVHTRRELQDLSYKINPVNKRCQNLNRTPAVDEAAGVETLKGEVNGRDATN